MFCLNILYQRFIVGFAYHRKLKVICFAKHKRTNAEIHCFTLSNCTLNSGVPKVYESPTQNNFINLSYKIYKDAENLYLANPQGKFAFPLNSLRTIRTIGEGATIPHWYKERSHTSEEYEPYGFFKNRFGVPCIPNYHILELVVQGDLLWIYFPNYEIKTIEKLTGLKAWGI